jgi:hypothetical protein
MSCVWLTGWQHNIHLCAELVLASLWLQTCSQCHNLKTLYYKYQQLILHHMYNITIAQKMYELWLVIEQCCSHCTHSKEPETNRFTLRLVFWYMTLYSLVHGYLYRGSSFLQNVVNRLPDYMASYCKLLCVENLKHCAVTLRIWTFTQHIIGLTQIAL